MWLLLSCHREDPSLRAEFVPSEIPGSGTVIFSNAPAGSLVSATFHLGDQSFSSQRVEADKGLLTVAGLKAGEIYSVQLTAETEANSERSKPFDAEIPGISHPVPPVSLDPWDPAAACSEGGYFLFTHAGDDRSGVAIIDRDGDYVWAVPHEDPDTFAVRARPGRDGSSVLWAAEPREIVNGALGSISRRSIDGEIASETVTRDLHDDFLEMPDGTLAWLAYEYSQPNNGATFQLLATDRILTAAEGTKNPLVFEQLFGTLLDYTHGAYTIPPEGYGGASVPGCDEFGNAASLARNESDGSLFFLWRWLDTLLALDEGGDVRFEWGGPYSDLQGEDSFAHGHISEVWDGGALVFDNRLPGEGPSRLVEYRFDESSYEVLWQQEGHVYEDGPGDVRRFPVEGCDHLLVTWPSSGRIVEMTREGEVVWGATFGGPIGRAHYLSNLEDFAAEAAW